MSEIRFSIPEPCPEDFSKMKKDERGRYCESCSKHVVDFSCKTKSEIVEYLSIHRNEKICGTFRKEQLRPLKRKWSLAGLLPFTLIVFITNLLVSCRVYKPRGGAVMFDNGKNGKGNSEKQETAKEHLYHITETCPPENYLGGSIVIAHPPPGVKKDSVITKDSVIARPDFENTTYVYFPSGNYELSREEQQMLSAFAKKLKEDPKQPIEIDGYTDGSGSFLTNQLVSRKRAESVRSFLRAQDIKNTITIKAHGSKNPVASNETEKGKAQNRRAEIIILK
ncbi:MAG: OmpA family protein [Bacteroidia bacterium]